MVPDDRDYLVESNDHRAVLRRLVMVAGDQLRLVTPTEMIADRSIELSGSVYPAGIRPPHLVNVLDDLMRIELVERVVPTAGESSYRPTELGLARLATASSRCRSADARAPSCGVAVAGELAPVLFEALAVTPMAYKRPRTKGSQWRHSG